MCGLCFFMTGYEFVRNFLPRVLARAAGDLSRLVSGIEGSREERGGERDRTAALGSLV